MPVYYLTHRRVSIPYVDTDNGYSVESFVLYNIYCVHRSTFEIGKRSFESNGDF
jgi:hypothetical protein